MTSSEILVDGYLETEGILAWMRVRTNRNYYTYSRICPNLLDFIQNIGGLIGAILPLGYVLTATISRKIFMSKVVEKVYHVRRPANDPPNKVAKRSKNAVIDGNQIDPPQSWYFKFKELLISRKLIEATTLQKEDIDHTLFAFLHRVRFKYTMRNVFQYFKNCLCMKNLRKLKHLSSNHIYYLF
jgi:hypothetical protein